MSVLEGDFFAVLDAVDGLLFAHPAECLCHGEVLHEGGDIEDNVLTIHPCADTQGVLGHPSVFVGGVPSLLEEPLELLKQDLWVLRVEVALGDVLPKLHHGQASLRDTATDCVTPTGTPWVGWEVVVVEGPRLERVAWVSRGEQDGVSAVSEGATEGFGDELEVGVFVGLHACVFARLVK